MKRILFVDDEPNILEGLQDLLRKYRREMEVVFATDGEAALAELRKRPFDAVVSDMRMPGMDGAALLQRVKQEYPDVIRIILSGHADRNAIFMALPVSHQFLAKPCDAEALCDAIQRSCRLRALLADESLRRQIGAIEKLPSLPRVYQELMAAMSRPDTSTAMITAIVERDSAMSAKMLQLVNSACFNSAKCITRVDHAVVYLGMEMIKNLALSVHVFTTLSKHSKLSAFESNQQHSILTARVAKRLLKAEQQAYQAFTAALLHDVGCIILSICIPESYAVVMETARTTNRPLHEVETEVLGVTHAAVGAYLLGLWGLPFPIVEAVAYHHHSDGAGETTFDVTSATALADSLVDSLSNSSTPSLNSAHLEKLNVLAELPAWTEMAKQEVHAG